MSRRVSLPGADELFRATSSEPAVASPPTAAPASAPEPARPLAAVTEATPARTTEAAGGRRPSGRERHDEKITVYCSAGELLDIERARLTLRGEHGLAVDRGRLVREALAVVLAELEEKGPHSTLVRRLRGG
jgi:hypothetical protein